MKNEDLPTFEIVYTYQELNLKTGMMRDVLGEDEKGNKIYGEYYDPKPAIKRFLKLKEEVDKKTKS